MRLILICLAAVLLSGCGYIAGKRVDFGSDFSNSNNPKIQELAGKTFYISNDDDYERLIQLKIDLRELSNSPTPTKFLQHDCELYILQITDQYDSGITGFIFPGKIKSPFGGEDKKIPSNSSSKEVETKKDTNKWEYTPTPKPKKNWWEYIPTVVYVFLFIGITKLFFKSNPVNETTTQAENVTPEQSNIGEQLKWSFIFLIGAFIVGIILVFIIKFFFPHYY